MLWRPRGFPYIDPEKDISASFAAICGGLGTHSEELAERGFDIEEVFAEASRDRALALKYGLTFIDPRGRNPFISTQEDPGAKPGTDVAAVDAKVEKGGGNTRLLKILPRTTCCDEIAGVGAKASPVVWLHRIDTCCFQWRGSRPVATAA